ncbi:mavicyanin-like [Salvia splendens]|uniref:mavicyanin-like n=1 Tax=Salvia splendens TaxID=180675 RepID=UPI001C252AE4|nr:mavicyanin-like [Salvia splendens]
MGGKMKYFLVLMVIICESCNGGVVHKVGESAGWTNINLTSSYYNSWTASKNFQVGDTILFEYNKEFHNVVRVTHKNFNECNPTAPYASWATGNDSFPITKTGHYYFICGLPSHCQAGQRVDIRVTQRTPTQSPSPSPKPAIDTPDTVAPTPAPAPSAVHPSKKSASSSLQSHFMLLMFVVATALAF